MPMGRREFLAGSLAAGGCAALGGWTASSRGDDSAELPRVAAINSIYRLRSHAYHIAGRFIHGYTIDGQHHQPPFQLVRMYNHQRPDDDLGVEVCREHGIELCDSATAALGGDRLDVDAVLLIIEHGDYPVNERGQVLYPRFELFEEITRVFRRSGRAVPVFCDKHLSYDFERAARMVATSRELGFGLMAGSSLPVTWRKPPLELPLESPVEEGVVVFGFDRGPTEIYWFHALESLQCMLERRRGGETGIRSVTCLEGDAVWRAADEGRFSEELMTLALSRCASRNYGEPRREVKRPGLILVEYRDGTRGAAVNLIEATSEFAFAARLKGSERPVSTGFYLPAPPGARFFDPLTFHIEKFFASGKPTYPVERTLLTSTALDHAMRSLAAGSRPVSHESLDIRYQAPADSGFFRGSYVDNAE